MFYQTCIVKKKKTSVPELEDVIENLGSPSEILDSLVRPDSLTDKVYKKDDKEEYIFPKVNADRKTSALVKTP